MPSEPPVVPVEEAFDQALALHRQGELEKAEAIYRRILEAVPDQAASIHCLGLIRSQRGDVDGALAQLRRAVELDPAHATFRSNLGAVLVRAGRHEDAVAACRAAASLDPALADAHANLGAALEAMGKLEEAVAAYRQAIALRPDMVAAHGSLAAALHKLGRAEEAAHACRAAVASNPDRPDAFAVMGSGLQSQGRLDEAVAALRAACGRWPQHAGLHARLGSALTEAGRLPEAEASHRRATEIQPGFAEAHNNLAIVLRELGRFEEAEAAYRRAIAIKPGFAEVHSNLARVLRDLGRTEESLEACRKAVALDPDLPDAHCNLGIALRDLGRLDDAIAAYRRALALRPAYADAHESLGLALLLAGNLADGWPEYEWRLRRRPMPPAFPGVPAWSGQNLADRTILVRGEQGIGDQIMFAGLIGDLARQGARCVVEADPRLEKLLARSFPLAGFLPAAASGQTGPAPCAIDCQVAMGSLPRRLRPDPGSFPRHAGYLLPDPAAVERLRRRYMQRYPGQRLVGLSWRGGTGHIVRIRSIALERWEPILRTPGAGFVSLQYGDCAAEIALLQQRLGLEVLHDPEIDPLASIDALAAQVAAMDLVISIDNSTVHMAGALGVPVWVLLATVPNWRWRLEGDTSPWYPSARLFRQSTLGDWSDVLARVARELAEIGTAS